MSYDIVLFELRLVIRNSDGVAAVFSKTICYSVQRSSLCLSCAHHYIYSVVSCARLKFFNCSSSVRLPNRTDLNGGRTKVVHQSDGERLASYTMSRRHVYFSRSARKKAWFPCSDSHWFPLQLKRQLIASLQISNCVFYIFYFLYIIPC